MEKIQKQKSILLIDDEQAEDRGVYFEKMGWTVFTAENGREAFTVLKSFNYRFDCIVLDQRMPKMDGREFIDKFVEKEAKIPVILLSAYATGEDYEKHYKGRVIAKLEKPTSPSLIEALAENIRGLVVNDVVKDSGSYTRKIFNLHDVDERTRNNEEKLEKKFINTVGTIPGQTYSNIDEHLFVVARRWNSWYPSF